MVAVRLGCVGGWLPCYLGDWVPDRLVAVLLGCVGCWLPCYLGGWLPRCLGDWLPGCLAALVVGCVDRGRAGLALLGEDGEVLGT